MVFFLGGGDGFLVLKVVVMGLFMVVVVGLFMAVVVGLLWQMQW